MPLAPASPPNHPPPTLRHLRTDSDSEVLLNVLADEVHRAHQRCLQTTGCDPNKMKVRSRLDSVSSPVPLPLKRPLIGLICPPSLSFPPLPSPPPFQVEFLFEAGASTMKLLKGAYSCLCLVNGVGMVAFRDPFGIRCEHQVWGSFL